MTKYTPSYPPMTVISKWIVILSVALIIFSIIDVMILLYAFEFLVYSVVVETLNLWQSFLQIISLLSVAIYIVSLYWFYRANKNIHIFGAKEIFSPRMAVIWWFVPVLQFWKPYQVVQQIWKASNPQVVLSDGTEWKNSASSSILKIWWCLWITYVSLCLFDALLPISAHVAAIGLESYLAELMSRTIIFIVLNISFMHLIRRISLWQEIKASKSV